MSIVTLKKKVQTKYNNLSVNSKQGFSINGTTRNQGFVGQTMLSRSLPRTIYKGAYPKGYGGCCGKFQMNNMIQSGVNYLNDPTFVKSSVMSTKGMLETQYQCVPPRICNPTGYYNYNIVKPDLNLNINTQQQYIDLIKKQALDVSGCKTETVPCIERCHKNGPKTNYNHLNINVKSDPTKIQYLSQSDYLEKLKSNCTKNDIKFVPVTIQRTPFGYPLQHLLPDKIR